MALSEKARKRFIVAMARRAEAEEILTMIESGGNPVADNVAELGALAGTYSNAAEPTGAEVDASVQVVADKVDELIGALTAAGIMAS